MKQNVFRLMECLEMAPEVGKPLPDVITYLPAGTHQITPYVNGEAKPTTVTIDASVASRLQESFQALVKAGRRPMFGFDHENAKGGGKASAWLKEFSWGGDGVKARVEWTASGKAALEGKDYEGFSPTVLVDDDGRIVGTRVNAGSLVNQPAFSGLTIMAAEADQAAPGDNTKGNMTETELQAALAAKDSEIAALKTEVGDLKTKAKASAEKRAKALVEAAAGDGRIPPKNTELQGKWIKRIAEDPEAEELLAAMPKSGVPVRVIEGGNAETEDGTAAANGEAQRVAVAEYRAAHPGMSFQAAWQAVRTAKPTLFRS